MKKRIKFYKKKIYLSWLLVAVLLGAGIWQGNLNFNVCASTTDGIYTIPVSLWTASSDSVSMGNDSLQQTGKIVVSNGEAHLYVKFKQMAFSGMTGYLSAFDLLKDISFNSFHYPEQYTLLAGNVVSTYDATDQFNGNDSTDVECAGKPYPKVISVPIEWEDNNIWVHVYVPVMGSLGFGNQLCRIHLDWDQMNEMTASEIEQWKQDELAEGSESPIPATESPQATGSENTPAPTTNTSASTNVSVDKAILYQWMEKAKALVSQTTVYAESSLTDLQNALTTAQKAYDSDTTQSVVDAQVVLLSDAIDHLVRISSEKLDKDNLADGKYYVYVYLWHATSDQASMGNPALNHKALLTVAGGVYTITMSTHPMTVGTITACLQSIQIKQLDGSYQNAMITERGNENNQPSVFSFDLPTREEYTSVLMDPKVEVMGKDPLPARLKIDWNTLITAEENAEVDTDTTTVNTSISQAVNKEDQKTKIKLQAAANVLPDGIAYSFKKWTKGSTLYAQAAKLVSKEKALDCYQVLVRKSGNVVVPNGMVTISLPVSDQYKKNAIQVYRIQDNKKIRMSGTCKNGYYTFATNTFGNFAMVCTKLKNSADVASAPRASQDVAETNIGLATTGTDTDQTNTDETNASEKDTDENSILAPSTTDTVNQESQMDFPEKDNTEEKSNRDSSSQYQEIQRAIYLIILGAAITMSMVLVVIAGVLMMCRKAGYKIDE